MSTGVHLPLSRSSAATHAQPDGPGQPSQISLDSRPDHRLLGRGIHLTPASNRTPRSTTSPLSSPAWAAIGRPQMRDVLATIQADQDAIIRAGSHGALVVDGGPGTGKTVVALHRAAYLLYADPRLGHHRGGVLFIGPHQPYLAYVADVLPSLGEEGVQTCTLRDLVAEGAAARNETDPDVVRLKSSADLVKAVESAVRFYEEPPTKALTVTHRLGRRSAQRRRLGRGVRIARSRDAAQRRARPGLGRAAHDPGRQARRRGARRVDPEVTAARRAAPSHVQPGVAAGRCGRRRRRPLVGAGLPAQVRALAQPA